MKHIKEYAYRGHTVLITILDGTGFTQFKKKSAISPEYAEVGITVTGEIRAEVDGILISTITFPLIDLDSVINLVERGAETLINYTEDGGDACTNALVSEGFTKVPFSDGEPDFKKVVTALCSTDNLNTQGSVVLTGKITAL